MKFDFEIKSKEHHFTDGQGGYLCDAPLTGLMMTWDTEEHVTCPGCLEKLRDRRIAARQAQEEEDEYSNRLS